MDFDFLFDSIAKGFFFFFFNFQIIESFQNAFLFYNFLSWKLTVCGNKYRSIWWETTMKCKCDPSTTKTGGSPHAFVNQSSLIQFLDIGIFIVEIEIPISKQTRFPFSMLRFFEILKGHNCL